MVDRVVRVVHGILGSEERRNLERIPLGADPTALLADARLRPETEIYTRCDLLYCLRWAVRDSTRRGIPTRLHPEATEERYRAIAWLVGALSHWEDLAA